MGRKTFTIDVGGWHTKFGRNYNRGDKLFANKECSDTWRSVVGRYKRRDAESYGAEVDDVVAIGNDVVNKSSSDVVYSSSSIIDHGYIRDSMDFRIFLDAIINSEFQYDVNAGNYESIELAREELLKEHSFILPTSIHPTIDFVRTTAEIVFESWGAPELMVGQNSTLSMFGVGEVTGVAVDIGYGTTQISPVVEGVAIPSGSSNYALGSEEINHMLRGLLVRDCHKILSRTNFNALQEIQKKNCFFSKERVELENLEKNTNTSSSVNATLPDGTQLTLNNELFLAPEVLFNPTLVNCNEIPPLPDMIRNSIFNCALDDRSGLMQHICMTGGVSLMKNCGERMTKEMTTVLPEAITQRGFEVKAFGIKPSWLGASIASELSSLDSFWCTDKGYHEYGPSRMLDQFI